MPDSVLFVLICTDISNQEIVVNPVRQRLVQKIELYEEGRILTSDLFSSGDSLKKVKLVENFKSVEICTFGDL